MRKSDLFRFSCVLLAALLAHAAYGQTERPLREGDTEPLSAWRFFQEVQWDAEPDSPWFDLLLPPSVFDGARLDLGDLRLYDAAQREIPYALRVREPEYRRQQVEAREFNRTEGPEGSRELSLDLGEEPLEHNQVELDTPGLNFRRHVRVEGSDDGRQWRPLADDYLLRFRADGQEVTKRSVAYPPSRFRYLRIAVFADPEVDDEPVELGRVAAYRRVELPGEYVTREAGLGYRQPVRVQGAPGSAWILDLGGQAVPCDRILVEIETHDFVRDWALEVGGAVGGDEPFRPHARGVWRRRAGEEPRPLIADFPEVRTARLRLLITDHRNPPLEIREVQYRAPARQVVFAANGSKPVRLYFGNPEGEAPHYDFARNLPRRLEPPPVRLSLAPREENPVYAPEPPPLTERWPWLIYLVLGLAITVLGALIGSLARQATAAHEVPQRGQIER